MVASVLINFGKFILKSVLASVIVCTISLSIMTKKFPPDLTQIRSTYEIIRNLQALSQKKPVAVVPESNPKPDPETVAIAPNDEVEIQELIQQRQKVIAPLTELPSTLIEEKQNQAKVATCQFQEAQIQQLKNKIEELDKQNLSLNQKFLEMKYKKQ